MSSSKPIRHDDAAARTEPVVDLLCRIADELQAMAHSVAQVSVPGDDVVTRIIGMRNQPFMNAMQGLDLTRQKLACLADFLSELAQSVPPHWSIDVNPAAEVVTLSQLAMRLRSSAHDGENSDSSDGDFEMF
ncbi:hypothetical protein SAMN05444161_1623 [Rhizobiales bacterium GAS191]|jgi:hypothetical protein|nr:hypothetical protein SAMN05519103_00726 [Rhizobiales bacterium GAS113]SEC60205.1 hypothetical protein SAMN05519104_1695 [Rhizobiales bacterium GAS188]SEC68425.1 hypothetical protein SAMN05444161_1623 [Rhizobiales bacterium GAS191]